MTAIDTRPLSHLSFGGVLRSEWIKLRSLRSTLWCYAIVIVLTIGLGLLLATAVGAQPQSGTPTAEQQQASWVQAATLGVAFSQLVVAVLGALVITGEYGTGMIRSTFAAVPKRWPALLAKALVFGVTTFVVALVSFVITALVVAPLLPAAGVHPDLGDGRAWLAIVGAAGYLALLGVLSLSIGAIIRNSAGGIATALGLILVVPTVLSILGAVTRAVWVQNLSVFLPDRAGGHLYAYPAATTAPAVPDVVVLDTLGGFLVLAAWVVVMFVVAVVLLKRRDA